MTPRDRIKRYAQLVTAASVLVFAMLSFFILVSPKLKHLDRVEGDLETSSTKLAAMRKEIEDARIAGPPVVGGARFEKFGILARDEEQLFLSDLIDFCSETGNTLNLVRRAESPRPAVTRMEPEQPQSGRGGSGAGGTDAAEQPRVVIERVPHTVNFSGTFLTSFYLLRTLEAYKRLLTVERMDILTDHRAGYPRVSGMISIDLYLVTSPIVPPTAEAASSEAASSEAAPAETTPAG